MPTLERGELLTQLGGYIERDHKGSGTFVFLDGEAGAGKTTVARALTSETPKSTLLRAGPIG